MFFWGLLVHIFCWFGFVMGLFWCLAVKTTAYNLFLKQFSENRVTQWWKRKSFCIFWSKMKKGNWGRMVQVVKQQAIDIPDPCSRAPYSLWVADHDMLSRWAYTCFSKNELTVNFYPNNCHGEIGFQFHLLLWLLVLQTLHNCCWILNWMSARRGRE